MNDELISALQAANAVKYGEFELSHGGTSEYYIDKYLFETNPTCTAKLAGVALGAVPLVAVTAAEMGCPYVIARKQAKCYGTANRIEGQLDTGESVVVLEDIATTGTSAKKAVEALRAAGATVERVIVVVDREEGASDTLAEIDVQLDSLLTAADLINRRG